MLKTSAGHPVVARRRLWSVPPANRWISTLLTFARRTASKRPGVFTSLSTFPDNKHRKRETKALNLADPYDQELSLRNGPFLKTS